MKLLSGPALLGLSLLLLSSPVFAEEENDSPMKSSTFSGLEMRSIGPALMSGRIADIVLHPEDPSTWITRVRVTIGGRTESTNLQGASAGVFDADDTHVRKTFSTVVSLRNQVYSAANKSDLADYN